MIHLSAVLLRQYIKKHWNEDDESFEQPAVAAEEKEVIRGLLLLSLDDPHRKVCTAISMAVACVASYDWPEHWPDFLPYIMKLFTDYSNMNGVHGALRCLALVSGDLDDKVVPALVPTLFPCLYAVVSSTQIFDKSLRSKALSIVYSCASVLGTMSGMYKKETVSLIQPLLKPWIEQFSLILEHPVQSGDPDDWSMRTEVLKCLNQFVQHFPRAVVKEFIVLLAPFWQTIVSSLNIYQKSAIEGTEDSFGGRYDSDGAERSLESFVMQLLECAVTIVGSATFREAVVNDVQELVYCTFGFLQITEQQAHSWSLDANQYISDEDENSYTCRVSGILLLERVTSSFGGEGIKAIMDAARRRLRESLQWKTEGDKFWWRIREAVIYGLASLSEQLVGDEVPEADRIALRSLVGEMLTVDFGEIGAHEIPFLYGRVFSTVPKFSSLISHEATERFLDAAMNAFEMDVPPPIIVGACRALPQLLPDARKEVVRPHVMRLFSSLAHLLKQASEETLHLVLDTLQAVVKAGQEATFSVEPAISPIILTLWASHVSDPFISVDAIEVLEAIKNAPGCIWPLVSRVLSFPTEQPEGLVAGSLDLMTMLLKNAPKDVVKAVYDVCFDPVIRLVLQSDDHGELQNATECLAAFVSGAGSDILTWGGDPGFVMRSLFDALSRLLDPDMESSGSFFVGNYILQLILHLPSQLVHHIHDLVAAVVKRMLSCKIAGLKTSLLLVIARLVHASSPNTVKFIDLLMTIPADGYENAFRYIMSEWVKMQGEMQGAYQIKVTTTALALLLSTKHGELARVNVQGHLIKSNAGITTRSRAKLAPEQWTVMPLHAKILGLLADVLIEIQEQAVDDDDGEVGTSSFVLSSILCITDEKTKFLSQMFSQDSDWEEIDGNMRMEQGLGISGGGMPIGRPSYEELAAMAKVFNENQDGNDDDDLISSTDPLNEINLPSYLVDFFFKFWQTDGLLFNQLCQSLAQPQRNAIQMVLNQ
ncbi:Importin-9-like protein [Drosera capensis]